jgi:hypothetical protein
MSDDPVVPSNSERFRKMAERIDHNSDAGFGGACVIIPPANSGDPIEVLLLDNAADPATFYSTVSTRLQLALDKIAETKAQQMGFGRR